MVELIELALSLTPLYILLAGLYYRQGKYEAKLDQLYQNIELNMGFKKR